MDNVIIAGIEVPFEEFNKWIVALDSGEYKQGIGLLCSQAFIKDKFENFYCCLGVACIVTTEKEKLTFDSGSVLAGAFPFDQGNAPEWLKRINDDFEHRVGITLSRLNDSGTNNVIDYSSLPPFSFPEIATLLELVYIHKILDEEQPNL